MEKLSKIFEQTFWQVLGKVVTSLSTFIILGLVTRNYGEKGTGVFTLALTYLGIFYLLSDFGFNAHVLKNLKSQSANWRTNVKSEWNKLLGTRLIWSGILVVLAVGLLPFWPFSAPDFMTAVTFGSLAIIGSGVFITCNLIFQGELKYNLSILATILGTLVSLVFFFLMTAKKLPISFLLLAHLIGWLVIALIALVLLRRFLPNLLPIFNKQYSINLFQKSWPIAATLSLNVIYFRADSFLIANFRPLAEVGIYNVAYSVFQSALVLPTFIMNSYYPMMLKSFGGVKKIGLGLLGLAVLGTIVTILFAPLIIKVLTGQGFLGSEVSLQILSLGFPAYFLSSLFMWMLVAKGKYKSMFLLYTSGLVFNLVLNFIYIPKYSFIAASWITVISEYVILLMQIFVLRGILR